MAPLDADFDLSITGFGQASGGARTRHGNNRPGFVEQSSDENTAWHRDAVDRWRRSIRSCAQVNL
jgi:hypothetical protein